MRTEDSNENTPILSFFRSFEQSIADVLTQALGEKWTSCLLTEPGAAIGEDVVRVGLAFSKGLSGSLQIGLTHSDASNIALKFMGLDGTAGAWNEDTKEAFDELLRQIVGQLRTNLEGEYGDTSVDIRKVEKFSDIGKHSAVLAKSASGGQAKITIVISTELLDSLAKGDGSGPAMLSPVGNTRIRERNLDVLMGVTLPATLRFGKKQVLLRDLLELNSGSVIELDRQVQEPVDLVLDGRLIARGEVVIVDGCYGLRVTEVASQRTRAELLR